MGTFSKGNPTTELQECTCVRLDQLAEVVNLDFMKRRRTVQVIVIVFLAFLAALTLDARARMAKMSRLYRQCYEPSMLLWL